MLLGKALGTLLSASVFHLPAGSSPLPSPAGTGTGGRAQAAPERRDAAAGPVPRAERGGGRRCRSPPSALPRRAAVATQRPLLAPGAAAGTPAPVPSLEAGEGQGLTHAWGIRGVKPAPPRIPSRLVVFNNGLGRGRVRSRGSRGTEVAGQQAKGGPRTTDDALRGRGLRAVAHQGTRVIRGTVTCRSANTPHLRLYKRLRKVRRLR